MAESKNVLSETLHQIAQENNIVKPKIVISDTERGGYIGIPSTVLIEDVSNGNRHEPLHLFLKSAPKDSREAFPFRETFTNEIVMYQDVLPEYLKLQKEKNVREPLQSLVKCYGCSLIDGNEFLIFEDLKKKGFVVWDKTIPMSPKGIEHILKELAKYYALSFALRDQKPDVFYSFGKRLLSVQANFFESTPAFLESIKMNGRYALNVFDPVEEKKICEALTNFTENDMKPILTGDSIDDDDKIAIIHGDCWSHNFMMKFEDPSNPDSLIQLKILDWQTSRLSSPVIDMSFFFYCNGSQEVFDNLDYYLKLFHNTLGSALKELGTDVEKVFPYSTLQDHWRKYAKFGLAFALTLISSSYNPNHTGELDMTELAKDDEGMKKHFAASEVQNNEAYRKRVRGIITHFVNKGLI